MSAVCRVNRLHHDWSNGLTCRWCDATRTPAEAILSGLASRRGGDEEAAQALLDAYRAEVAAETRRADAESFERYPWYSEGSDYDNGRDATVTWVVSTLRRRAEAGEP